MSATQTLGQPSPSNGQIPMPFVPVFATPLRTLSADDASASAVPTNERIDLSGSKWGVGNIIHLRVKGQAGNVVALWEFDGTDYFLVGSQTTTEDNQIVDFFDLVSAIFVPVVTTVSGTVVIQGGGTK